MPGGSNMKERRYNTSPFNEWRDNKIDNYGKYHWPQITYDWGNGRILRIVYENPNATQIDAIKWPDIDRDLWIYPNVFIQFNDKNLPNVWDHTTQEWINWDYKNWAKDILKASSNPVNNIPSTYWNYRSMAKPYGNKACDIDALEKTDKCWFGVEATRFNKTISSENEAVDYFFDEILAKRPAGFNKQQLQAQKGFMDGINGKLYLIIHHEAQGVLCESDNAYACEIDNDCLNAIVGRNKEQFKPKNSSFAPFSQIYHNLMTNCTL